VTWIGGVFTSFGLSRTTSDRLSAALFGVCAMPTSDVTFSSGRRPEPLAVNIRTTAGYSVADNTTCLPARGQDTCVRIGQPPDQAQLTMDTDLHEHDRGVAMAYVLNEERQSTQDLAVCDYGIRQLSTSVGQLR